MSFSNGFKINVNKLNADEATLVLLEINHSSLSEPIRFVHDSIDLVSNGNNYIAMPFKIVRQSDVQGELPKVQLIVNNVGRTLVKWVDSTGGGRGASVKIMLARRSTPNTIEETLNLEIDRVVTTIQTIAIDLIIQNNLNKRSVKMIYDSKTASGLF